MDNVIRHLRRAAARTAIGTPTDAELLERFVVAQEEAAFAMLVRRHGPMVLGVCLRVLHHRQDAEDAFQATFLTLVRKGHGIRERGALASWLYRVAFRAALRLKTSGGKHSVEPLAEVAVTADPVADAAWRELRPVLDLEVQRLPAKYRAPMVLCYLEGKTYEEAADALGCPKGTVAIRLLRGKLLLKTRLARRGLALSAGLVAAGAVVPGAQAFVPPALSAATVAAALGLASGAALTVAASAGVAALVHGISRGYLVTKLQMAAIVILGVAVAGSGAAAIYSLQPRAEQVRAPQIIAEAKQQIASPQKPAQVEPAIVQHEPQAQSASKTTQAPVAAPIPKREAGTRNSVVICRMTAIFTPVTEPESTHWDDLSQCVPGRRAAVVYVVTETTVARSGLACRESLKDELPAPPPERVCSKKPTRSAPVAPPVAVTFAKLGSKVYHIIFITDNGRIFVFKLA